MHRALDPFASIASQLGWTFMFRPVIPLLLIGLILLVRPGSPVQERGSLALLGFFGVVPVALIRIKEKLAAAFKEPGK